MAGEEGEEEISPAQTEKLIQFQDLTGIEDMATCKQMLSSNNWDLEVSVQHHLVQQEHPEEPLLPNGGIPNGYDEIGGTSPPPVAPRPLREPVVNVNSVDQRIYSVVARQQPVGILGWTSFFVFLPFRFFYSALYDILSFVYRLFRPDPRLMVTNPLGDVMQMINSYDAKYGSDHPVFYQGTYAQALSDAKQELTFLIVYLHSDNNSDCDLFCRTTLANPNVIDLINARSLFWICSVETAEGYRVSRALQRRTAVATFPFLAVIVYRESRMSVVARFEGAVDATAFAAAVNRVFSDNETAIEVAKADRRERSLNQHLRQEQDAAFLESLKADQEKERRKKEEEEERKKEFESSLREAEEAQREADLVEDLKKVLLAMSTPEPDSFHPDAIKIVLKCPSGLRLERRFLKTQPIQDLFNYIFCHPEAPEDFSIIKNFPRSEIKGSPPKLKDYRHFVDDSVVAPSESSLPTSPSFVDVGITSSEMLFVQDNQA